MYYVTDTHSLIWFLTEEYKKLGKSALEIYEEAEKRNLTIIIPSIVLAETLAICEKERIEVKFEDLLNKINDSLNYVIYDLDIEILKEVVKILKGHDLHDRIIVATAVLTKSKIITKDEKITKSKIVEII